MEPTVYIRKSVFGFSQAAFAAIAGATQGTVSKWEAGELTPTREHMERIRAEAARLNKPWDDRWFFEAPIPSSSVAEVAA